MSKNVLIIDDDPDLQTALRDFFMSRGFTVQLFTDAETALNFLQNAIPPVSGEFVCDLIICDLKLPGMDGISFVEKATEWNAFVPVILVTAFGDQENAALAMHKGAFDYITKPINFTELAVVSDRAIKIANLEWKFKNFKFEVEKRHSFGRMIAKSKAMQDIFSLARKISPTTSSVLITGESGTGKEVLAEAIHENSLRHAGPFVAVNCSAIPHELLESELFGHKKGSFTGAFENRIGLFAEANGGTIFLDEIGDMPPQLQSKLLRVLQERKVRPVGENKTVDIDVRILSATNRDLKQLIAEGKFREDLFYRLCVIPLRIPSLRERKEDIGVLAHFFLEKYAAKNKSAIKGFTRKAMARLLQLKWAGNVRELENTIERAVILSQGSLIDDLHILIETASNDEGKIFDYFSNHLTLRALEKEYIQHVLSEVDGRKEKAAKILGIDRKTLYRKEREYELSPKD